MTAADSPARQLDRYLQTIAGDRRGDELLEIRYATGDGRMRRRFISIRRLDAAARAIRSLSSRTDVYCGVLLRSHRAGGRGAVTSSHLAFVDVDAVDALDRLQRSAMTPTMIVSSGTAGHAHAYWALRTRVGAVELEQANRTLASHLGGDLASVDAARILRPAGTLSHKYRPPASVELLRLNPATRYEVAELLDGLQPPPPRPAAATAGPGRAARTELDELLLAIPAATYVRELTGLEPRRDGKVSCPFHELSAGRDVTADVSPACSPADASLTGRRAPLASTSGAASDPLRLVPPPVYFEQLTGLRVGRSGKLHCLFHDDRSPSLHVYREPDRGWYCFGCGRGGSIYDLAALLSGRETRGTEFLELKRDLERLFTSPVTTAAVRRAPWMVADRDQSRSRT
jgi:hypothetical protein